MKSYLWKRDKSLFIPRITEKQIQGNKENNSTKCDITTNFSLCTSNLVNDVMALFLLSIKRQLEYSVRLMLLYHTIFQDLEEATFERCLKNGITVFELSYPWTFPKHLLPMFQMVEKRTHCNIATSLDYVSHGENNWLPEMFRNFLCSVGSRLANIQIMSTVTLVITYHRFGPTHIQYKCYDIRSYHFERKNRNLVSTMRYWQVNAEEINNSMPDGHQTILLESQITAVAQQNNKQ